MDLTLPERNRSNCENPILCWTKCLLYYYILTSPTVFQQNNDVQVQNEVTQLFRLVITGKLLIFPHVALNHSRLWAWVGLPSSLKKLNAGASGAGVQTMEEGQFSSIVSLSVAGIILVTPHCWWWHFSFSRVKHGQLLPHNWLSK